MKPSDAFEATFTVPNLHQRLSARRPVQVYTYAFGGPPEPGAGRQAASCPAYGAVHDFSGVSVLQPHDHEHHEIAVVTKGEAVHRTAVGAQDLRPGSVLAIAPGEVHAFERFEGLRMVNCTYLTEWLFYDVRELLSVEGLAPLFFPRALSSADHRLRVPQWFLDEDMLQACLRELRDIAAERDRDDPSPILMRRTLEKLMLMLHRAFTDSGAPQLMPMQPGIRTTLERREECVLQGDSLDPAALAHDMGLSRDYFARQFKQAMGCTPTDYYQHRRVQQASCLLLGSGQPITEVAHLLGYFDASHFSRLFKRYRGLSPREFRSKYASE